jgi:zinc transport system substrate-binding protein
MIRSMKRISHIAVFLFLAASFSWPVPNPDKAAAAATPLRVAATIFPLADIARRIIGPGNQVILILPAGASPHTFDLTPGKVKELQGAHIIFKIGGVDDWIDAIAESMPQAAIISLQKNIALQPPHEQTHHHGGRETSRHDGFDPHYWLDAANGVIIARNITEALASVDPARSAVFRANYAEYSQELAGLHRELQRDFAGLKNNKMLVLHDAWRYFAAAYGLQIAAVFQSSPGREPAPRDLQYLYAQVKNNGIKAVFSEPQLSTESLEPFVGDLGLKLVILDPLGGTAVGDTYVGMLRRNARAILRALGN